MFFKWKYIFIIAILWIRIKRISAQKGCPPLDAILPCRCLMRGEEYQIWCSHSDLPRVLDGLRTVGEYITDPIDELILENNFLPSLPGRTFFPLKILRLMLRYNGLERVSSDWLVGLQSSLVEIFIVEPKLRSLPDDCLSQLNVLQAITIQTNLLKRLPLFTNLPKLRYLQIESESLVELSPVNFKNNPSLEKLHITSSPRLTRLEANLLQDLPYLNLVNISHCGLNWMHPRAISRLPLLKELWLVGNKITDAGMIGRGSRELPQLEIIKLDYNYIDKIDEAAFVDLPALKKVYLSNNRITELHHGAFHRVPLLRSLDLNRNMLRRVHPESFLQHSGSGLEELSLVENDISHVAELRSLLDALPSLVFLDMSYNNLEAIPFGALRGHPTLEHLNLDYNKLNVIDREAFMAMPALRELRLKNNSLADNLEMPFWNLPALKGLDLSGNFFKRLDPNFLANLPSLRRIDLSNNDLTIIDPALFLPTPSLEHINVSFNEIKTIHPSALRNLLNLYELDISHNHLLEFLPGLPRSIEYLHLHHNTISEISLVSTNLNLPFLRMLDLSYNKIQNIPKGSFKTLPQLRRLYLGRNLLQYLEENCLAGLNRLETLDISENRLEQIHINAFKETPELKEINLNNNHLDILIPDIFKSTPLLQRLNLSKNQLAEILPGTLDNNLEIRIIDASHNALVQLPSAFYGLKNLQNFDLTDNRIKNIDPEIIGSLINLKELKLSKNFIQDLRYGTFHNLPHLKTLYLDNNELEYIEPNSIAALPVLKSLKLNKNKIKEMPNSAFSKLPLLQMIELQENELRNIAPEAFNLVPHLLMLNLSYNQLPGLEEAGLRSLRSLEMLDVSNNRISKIADPSLEKMEWLVELRIDNNNICGVQGSAFNGMPRLRVLSLKNNKLISFPEHAVQRLRGNIAVLDIDGNPLACTCNLLWLQAWLQESSQIGPHCADGIFLREMPLSRQDCPEEKITDLVAPGCEAEPLSAPGVYSTSQVFSHHWMNLKTYKNITKQISGNKNNLAPSPQESDYFYDEYVDYPSYNDSIVDTNDFPNGKRKDKEEVTESVTMKISMTTKSPHYTAGDTPTIYAASKNKTKKPNIPPKVSNSPSTSGFTFFGVPLSNLNLNNLLGGGTGRLETKPSTTIVAERKTAILNNPTRNTGMNNVGNMPSNLPLKMQPAPYMQPPSLPEIQTGFVPILPSYGGFKPIPNPNLPVNSPTIKNIPLTENPTDATNVSPSTLPKVVNLSLVGDNINRQFPATSQHQNTLSNSVQRNENIETSIPPSLTRKTNLPISNFKYHENVPPNPVNITTKLINVKDEKLRTRIQVESEDENENTTDSVEIISVLVQEITTEAIEQTTLIPELDTFSEVKKNDNILTESSDDIRTVSIITTEVAEIYNTISPTMLIGTAEAVPPNITSSVFKNTHIDLKNEKISNEGEPATPLSALLIPGGQQLQSQLKHGGRSTITKVPSPYIAPNASPQSILELQDPLSHREGKNTHDSKITSATEETSDDDTNWYFANYNKSILDPYVARITNTNAARGIEFHQFLYVILFTFHIETILILL